MIALLWLALAWMAGRRWLKFMLGDAASLLQRPDASPWPAIIFRAASALWVGVLPLIWLTYLVAWFFAAVLPDSIHPLLIANPLVMIGVIIWLIWPHLRRKVAALQISAGWSRLSLMIRDRSSLIYLLPILVWLLLAGLTMLGTFYQDGTLYRAGVSVFSDFAPHTALVSSFSQGQNWPTEYPHFANDGISYHFMFFFLCGNLNYLGLSLDWAINLPSILGLLSFCVLLGLLAVQLTGRRATYLLAPLLLFCRSSFAFFTWLGDLIRQFSSGPKSWPLIFSAMLSQDAYIGNTTNDSWGLWGVNVYANQRHLLPGLAIAVIVIFLFLPDLNDGLARRPTFRLLFLSRDFWQVRGPDGWRRMGAALLLCLLLPYFHGSVLVALLLIMIGLAVFSTNRLAFIIVGAGAFLSALLQSWVFAGQASSVVNPAFFFGFISPDKSPFGVLLYMLEMSGILLPLIALVFWLRGRRRKVLLASFLLPLLFALTVSLTPDVTVNHKLIMISFAFCNIYIADLLIRMWVAHRTGERSDRTGGSSDRSSDDGTDGLGKHSLCIKLMGRGVAVFLTIVITITGVQEMVILHNISQRTVAIDSASPLVVWIEENTAPDSVFVSAPYHYNAFYLSGRSTWLGHAYYAWSAGHDTTARLSQEQWLLTGCGGDLNAVRDMVKTADLDYLLIDNTLREHPEFSVDEAFFREHFTIAAEFPQLGNAVIIDLRFAAN